ncbi:MAG TPA: hypothetical protein VGO63_00605 [Candidatus Paceibacterota bacterium]|jgi:hypothetical protein|nr:hypothetical protein [Candidatus Paceibacterota bacterium]
MIKLSPGYTVQFWSIHNANKVIEMITIKDSSGNRLESCEFPRGKNKTVSAIRKILAAQIESEGLVVLEPLGGGIGGTYEIEQKGSEQHLRNEQIWEDRRKGDLTLRALLELSTALNKLCR